MLWADFSAMELMAIVAGALGTGGVLTLAMKFYFDVKKNQRDARREDMALDSEPWRQQITGLQNQNTKLRSDLDTLQSRTLERIIAAHDEHQECERKYAALEVKFQVSEQRSKALEDRVRALEGAT